MKSIPSELTKLAGAVNEAMQLTDLAPRWETFKAISLRASLRKSLKSLRALSFRNSEFK